MFCDRCGTELPATATFCSSCGKNLNPIPQPAMALGRVEGHVRTLAMLWIAYSLVRLIGGWLAVSFFEHFPGPWMSRGWDFPLIGHGLGGILSLTGIAGIVAGWGLMERHSWARMLAIVLAILSLVHFPLGTGLAMYTLWVLMPSESAREYERTARTI